MTEVPLSDPCDHRIARPWGPAGTHMCWGSPHFHSFKEHLTLMLLCVLEKQYSVLCLVGNTSLPLSFLQPPHI